MKSSGRDEQVGQLEPAKDHAEQAAVFAAEDLRLPGNYENGQYRNQRNQGEQTAITTLAQVRNDQREIQDRGKQEHQRMAEEDEDEENTQQVCELGCRTADFDFRLLTFDFAVIRH